MIRTRQYILALGDFLMLGIALFLMVIVRFGLTDHDAMLHQHITAFWPLFVLWIAVFFIFNLYDIRAVNPSPRTIGRIGLAMLVSLIVSGLYFYLRPTVGISPHTNLLIVSIFSFVLMTLWRRLFYILFASYFSRRIMLVGSSAELKELADHLAEQTPLGRVTYHMRGLAELLPDHTFSDIDLLITDATDPKDIVFLEKRIPARVLTLRDAYAELFAKIPLSLMTDDYATRLVVRARNYTYPFTTRVGEILFSAVVLIITSPILLIAGIAKKLEDGGDVFLRHHLRIGKDGKVFALKKMRSMIMHADATGNKWTEVVDPRITPVGRIIRKLHIDEIPQLWNVIRGDLSLVGPRPEQPEFVEKLENEVPYYYMRHTIKPGFTGWAQIKFHYARTVDDSSKKLEYDLYYLENRSPLLDLGIVLKTIQIIFTH